MGRGDNRRSPKMRQRVSQQKKKDRAKSAAVVAKTERKQKRV